MRLSLKKTGKILLYTLYLAFAVLALLELAYRYYWVDFYELELTGMNDVQTLQQSKSKQRILAMGDSFTADPKSYLRHLQDSLPGYQIINSAVSGTCIMESSFMAPHRIRSFPPDIFLYQIYLGNDLLELHHPYSSKLSFPRRIYWWLSDRIRVLAYLNYRLLFIRQRLYQDLPTHTNPQKFAGFSPSRYSARSRMHFRAEPFLIENMVFLKNGRAADLAILEKRLRGMLDRLPENSQVIILVLPHCMQVNPVYRDRMLQIGAQLQNQEAIFQEHYPFYTYLNKQFADSNIHVINPLPLLRQQDIQHSVYYDNDPHLNEYGQLVLGKFIATFIKDHLAPPKSSIYENPDSSSVDY